MKDQYVQKTAAAAKLTTPNQLIAVNHTGVPLLAGMFIPPPDGMFIALLGGMVIALLGGMLIPPFGGMVIVLVGGMFVVDMGISGIGMSDLVFDRRGSRSPFMMAYIQAVASGVSPK